MGEIKRKQLFIFGNHRSGHHAIKHWLSEQKQQLPHLIFSKERTNADVFYQFYQVHKNKEYPPTQPILVLRDFDNWAASAMKMELEHGTFHPKQLELREQDVQYYISHCKEYLFTSRFCCILYNNWFKIKKCRKWICEDLDLYFTDNGLNCVPLNGKGSSFDGFEYQNNAQSMNVLERYKQISKEKMSEIHRKFPEAKSLSDRIFGDIYK